MARSLSGNLERIPHGLFDSSSRSRSHSQSLPPLDVHRLPPPLSPPLAHIFSLQQELFTLRWDRPTSTVPLRLEYNLQALNTATLSPQLLAALGLHALLPPCILAATACVDDDLEPAMSSGACRVGGRTTAAVMIALC